MTYIPRRMRTVLTVCVLLSTLSSALAATPEDYNPEQPETLEEDHLFAEAAFLFDMDSAEVLLSKNSRVRMYPASTTKIMTGLLALESGIGLDETVTVPREAANVPEGSSVLGVRQGDQITWRDLLYGLMIRSGNDAANAIAVLTSGSIEAFVQRMNEKAAELHCEGTHFVNAHGYHDSDHYTTAQDLARMALYAMRSADFREIVAAPRRELTVVRKGKTVTQDAENRNSLLVPESNYYYPDATGIKTGHHNKAGRCVVASAERAGARLIAIVMNCSTEERQFADAKKLFEYGFTRYDDYTMADLLDRLAPEVCRVNIENPAEDDPTGGQLALRFGSISGGEITRRMLRDSEKAMNLALDEVRSTLDIQWSRPLTAPVSAGEPMGTLRFTAPDGVAVTAELLADRDVAARPEPTPTPGPADASRPARPETESGRGSGPPLGLFAALAALMGMSVFTAAIVRANRQRKARARRRRRAAARRKPSARSPRSKGKTVSRPSHKRKPPEGQS